MISIFASSITCACVQKQTEAIFPSMYTSLLTLCVCGDSFNLQHSPKGELVVTRHNELRNFTAEILGEVCKKCVYQAVTYTNDGGRTSESSNASNQARTDVSARGLWINGQTVFCDVRVFNPLARCHLHHSLPAVHKKNENKKNPRV